METNQILGIVLAMVGISDLVIAQVLGERLPAPARLALYGGAVGFAGLGAALLGGAFKLV